MYAYGVLDQRRNWHCKQCLNPIFEKVTASLVGSISFPYLTWLSTFSEAVLCNEQLVSWKLWACYLKRSMEPSLKLAEAPFAFLWYVQNKTKRPLLFILDWKPASMQIVVTIIYCKVSEYFLYTLENNEWWYFSVKYLIWKVSWEESRAITQKGFFECF